MVLGGLDGGDIGKDALIEAEWLAQWVKCCEIWILIENYRTI